MDLSKPDGEGEVTITSITIRDSETTLNFEGRSEEHTSELQSLVNLVCRLLLEKKNILIQL